MTEYLVIYEQAEDGGWGAYLPDIPGVVAVGKTKPEVERGIAEALSGLLEDETERDRLPSPTSAAGVIAV